MDTYDGLTRGQRVCDYANPSSEGLLVPEVNGSLTYVPPVKKYGSWKPTRNNGRFDTVPNKRHLFDTPIGRMGFGLTIHESVWDSEDHLTKVTPLKGGRSDKFVNLMNGKTGLCSWAWIYSPLHLRNIRITPVYKLAEGLKKDRRKLRDLLKLRPTNRWTFAESEPASEDDNIRDAMREHHVRSGAPARADPTGYDPRFAETDAFVVSKKDHKVQRHTPDNVDRWYYIPNLPKHSLYIDLVDDDFEEYTTDIATPSEDLQKYQTLKETEIDFFGVSPYKKDNPPKVRSYWVGEVYLRNTASGRATQSVKEAVAEYFNVSPRTVMYCAQTARDSNNKRVIKGTNIPLTGEQRLEGDWVLKNFTSIRNLVPWKTADGIRPWWMWSFAGTADMTYAALRQQL